MKRILLYTILILPALWACEDEIEVYNYSTNSLNFKFDEYMRDTTIHETMTYLSSEWQRDTVWVEVETSGFITDYAREFCLKQVPYGEWDAKPGIHYIALDDSEVISHYVIPANGNSTQVPIIFLRDTSLMEHEYTLKLQIAENTHFATGIEAYQTRTIFISDIIIKPETWDNAFDYWFGSYGDVKYRFMIDAAASIGTIMNEDFVGELAAQNDIALNNYWLSFFKRKLTEENAHRAEQGLDVLREEPTAADPEGTIVTFD